MQVQNANDVRPAGGTGFVHGLRPARAAETERGQEQAGFR